MPNSQLQRLFNLSASVLLTTSLILLLVVVWLDHFVSDFSLGVLYVVPMLPAGLILNRWQILLFGFFLGSVRMMFINDLQPAEMALRFLMGLFAYWATGFFLVELVRNRRLILIHNDELEEEQKLRRAAESHLRALAESSPAAIFTLDENARILSANRAAADLLGLDSDSLAGISINPYLPVLSDALKFGADRPAFRTAAQCQGRRRNGDVFLSQIWFSTYSTSIGRRLAAIAVDISEEMREREEQNVRQLLANNRIVAAAVSHEIRNVCAAIAVVHSRLRGLPELPSNEDFRALGGLVEALSRIAATELHSKSTDAIGKFDLADVLSQLRVIIEPDWRDAGGSIEWGMPENVPAAIGESFGALQAFMNLSRNSLRAVNGVKAKPFLAIEAESRENRVLIYVTDSGPGVSDPQHLFEPFQSRSGNTGLGLYVSRAILRSYGGDLRYDPVNGKCRFVIELTTIR